MPDDETAGPGGPFVFRGRLTEDDAADMNLCLCRVAFRPAFRWLALGAATAIAGVAAADIAVNGPDFPAVGCLVVLAALVLVLPRIPAWTARDYYRRHREQYLEAEVRLTPERVSVAADAYRSEFAWNLLGGVVNTPKGLLFYDRARRALFWLPSRLFEDDGELRRRVLAMASLNGVRVHRP